MTQFVRLSRFAAALTAIVAVLATVRQAAAEETVRLAFLKTLGIVPMIDAQQMGYFRKRGSRST